MKTSEVLKLGKRYLAKNFERTEPRISTAICFALGDAYNENKMQAQDCDRVRAMIHQRLGHSSTLRTWLWIHHGIEINSVEELNKLQATRHAWVDSMIEEFAAKGD